MTGRLVFLVLVVAHLLASAAPVFAAENPYGPVRAGVRDEVRAATEGRLSSYALDVGLDPAAGTIAGTQRVDYLNTTGQAQRAIPFRLYPNADYYGDGGVTIQWVRVDGALVAPVYSPERTVLSVPLPGPLAPGERVKIAFRYLVDVPLDSNGTFGVFRRDSATGTWTLADWYPIVAGWEPGTGWHVDPPTSLGDPTFSEAAFYDVDLTLPAGWTPAATGEEQSAGTIDGRTRWSIESGPAREFTLVVDDDFRVSQRTVDGTTVRVLMDGAGDASAAAALVLDEAAASLRTYAELLGPYPYDQLDLLETDLAGALGVSWTGLLFLDGPQLLRNPAYVAESPERLRFTVAHEVGHQWIGGLVGLNSNDHAFLVEGLTNYLAIVATERQEGAAAGHEQFLLQCVRPYLQVLERGEDAAADQPISETLPSSFATLIYGKAAIGFHAIRLAMGDEAFFAALGAWTRDAAFGISGPAGLRDAFEAAAPAGVDIAGLWRTWFEQATTTVADVQALLDR